MTHLSPGPRLGALALAAALLGASAAPADPPSAIKTQRVITLLQRGIDVTAVPEKLKFKDAIELISTRLTKLNMGKEVLIVIDINAFKRENDEVTLDSIFGEEVEMPAIPKRLKVATLLRLALDKLPSRNATNLIRGGVVEITTVQKASPAGLLKQKVAANFAGTPLKDAIQELSEMTGATVVLDQRAADKLKQSVTVTFHHDTTLGAALRMLADMNDLKLVVLEGGLYITTPQNAAALRREQEKERPPSKDAPWTPPGAGNP
jgi:hypothetical protein